MTTHSSTLAWKITWMEEPGGYSPWGCKESDTAERLHLTLPMIYLPFYFYLCLKNYLFI